MLRVGLRFTGLRDGRYTVGAEAGALRSERVAAVVAEGTSGQVVLRLGRQEMEFSDKADFSVAGVTDWTAVGGHGSDATLRTSEALAEKTLSLRGKPSGFRFRGGASSGGGGGRGSRRLGRGSARVRAGDAAGCE